MWNGIKGLLAGVAVMFGLLCLFAGAAGAYAIVYCGGGPAAIPVLLVSWLVGLLVLSAGFKGLSGTGEELEPARFASFVRHYGTSSQGVIHVAEYLHRAKTSGKPDAAIREALGEAGWGSAVIEEAERVYARWVESGRGG